MSLQKGENAARRIHFSCGWCEEFGIRQRTGKYATWTGTDGVRQHTQRVHPGRMTRLGKIRFEPENKYTCSKCSMSLWSKRSGNNHVTKTSCSDATILVSPNPYKDVPVSDFPEFPYGETPRVRAVVATKRPAPPTSAPGSDSHASTVELVRATADVRINLPTIASSDTRAELAEVLAQLELSTSADLPQSPSAAIIIATTSSNDSSLSPPELIRVTPPVPEEIVAPALTENPIIPLRVAAPAADTSVYLPKRKKTAPPPLPTSTTSVVNGDVDLKELIDREMSDRTQGATELLTFAHHHQLHTLDAIRRMMENLPVRLRFELQKQRTEWLELFSLVQLYDAGRRWAAGVDWNAAAGTTC